jgi:hypothetical protein
VRIVVEKEKNCRILVRLKPSEGGGVERETEREKSESLRPRS